MACALHVYIVPKGGGAATIEHTFYGETREECQRLFEEHQEVCDNFGPAVQDGRTTQEWDEDAEIPEFDEQ